MIYGLSVFHLSINQDKISVITLIISIITVIIAAITILMSYILAVKTIQRNHYDNFFDCIRELIALIYNQIILSMEEKNVNRLDPSELNKKMSDYYFLLWSSYEIYIKNILGFNFPAKKIECYAKEVIDIGNKYIEYTFEKENIEKSILDSYRNEDMARLREILYELNKFFIDFDVFKGPIRRRIALIKLRKKEKRDKN